MGTPASGFDKFVDIVTKAQKRKSELEKEQATLRGELMKMQAKAKLSHMQDMQMEEYKRANPTAQEQYYQKRTEMLPQEERRKRAESRVETQKDYYESKMGRMLDEKLTRGEKVHPGLLKKYGRYVKPETVDIESQIKNEALKLWRQNPGMLDETQKQIVNKELGIDSGVGENYSENLRRALSAVDAGQDEWKVYQKLAGMYPSKSSELKRILIPSANLADVNIWDTLKKGK